MLLGVGPAAAETAAQVRDLASRAHTDPGALDRLEQVHDIDGRPVDLRRALDGARGPDLDRRLDLIESSAAGAAGVDTAGLGADGPRRQARRILAERRFRPPSPPKPLAGTIHRLGVWLGPVTRPLGRWLAPVGRFFKRVFSNAVATGLLGLIVIAMAALATVRLARRRARVSTAAGGDAAAWARLDPDALDRDADAAEAAGDLEHAFRLRFLAGVVRLDRQGALDYRASLTTGDLLKTVRSPTFPSLALAFDEIAYGGRPPAPDDLARAKRDWPRVLQEARR